MAIRKILAIIIALAMLFGISVCLSGCSDTEKIELAESEIGGLVMIAKQENFAEGYIFEQYILYDPDTLVMYVMITKPKAMTMSVLYNADGTPKQYNPEK